MTICEKTDFTYPLLADVFYPIVEQGAYGNVKKQWILDRTIAVALNPAGRKYQQQVQPNSNITLDNILIGRTKNDILSSSRESLNAITNVIIANVRDASGKIIYNESAGIRSGKSTIFEISTFLPIVGPFGSTEYYKLVVSRSDNQAADI
jgi:hypothetical protein